MKKKSVSLLLVTSLILGLLLTGCPARKPAEEPAPPETIIVPEVSRIFFTEVELAEGPELARQLVANNQGGEMTVWFEAEENFWIIVQAAKDSDELLRIEEVLQRIPSRDTFLVEVRLNEREREKNDGDEQEANRAGDIMLGRLDLNQRPHGIAFLFDSQLEAELENGEREEKGVSQKAPAREKSGQQTSVQPPAPKEQQEEQSFIEVQEPKPNNTVTSPVQVLGRAKVSGGTVHFRLKNEKDEVIAESSTTATAAAPQTGTFSGVLSFSPPAKEINGTLEVFNNGKNGEPENLVAVPVVIK